MGNRWLFDGFAVGCVHPTGWRPPLQGRKSEIKISLDEATRAELEGLLRRQKTPAGLARRARAMLLLAAGETFIGVARQTGLADRHVRKWARRFVERGVTGLMDKASRKPGFSPSRRGSAREVGL